jgi:TatD DNase family protein
MYFIDTHTHLYLEESFPKQEIESLILKAKENKVEKFFLPNIDVSSIEPMLNLCKKYENFYPMIGIHPSSIKEDFKKQLEILETYFEKEKFYAIGEVGIDLYWDKTFINEQIEAFQMQIVWAKKRNLPLILHIRKGFDEALMSLNKYKNYSPLENDDKKILGEKPYKGIFHCFSGDINQAKKAIELGFKIGIGGVVTFKNAHLVSVVENLDIDDIVLETDAPYLAPTPFRGQRNDSSLIPIIAQKVSQIKNISIEEVAERTSLNAEKIFF